MNEYIYKHGALPIIRSVLVGECDPLIIADFCEESGEYEKAEAIRKFRKNNDEWHGRYSDFPDILKKMFGAETLPDDYDIDYVFAYAVKPEPALPNDDISLSDYTQLDVKRVIAYSPGQNDGDDWLIAGQLWDDRFFFLHAGCDYTGWG